MEEKTKQSTEVSRRRFLQGMGAIGATVVATGLAACAPSSGDSGGNAGAPATDSGSVTTGYDWKAQSKNELAWLPPEPADPADIAEEKRADVVVIGSGVAGTCAARKAAEAGASVILIEKAKTAGVCRSGEYAVPGKSKVFATWKRGEGFDDYVDPELIVDREMEEMCYYPKRAIYSRWAHNVGPVFDWFCDAMGDRLYIAPNSTDPVPTDKEQVLWPFYVPLPEHFDWRKEAAPTYPVSVKFSNPDQHAIVKANVDKAIEHGTEVLTGHFAEKLIKEGDRITGVFVRDAASGTHKKITANKGVILATGDYSSNKDILAYYNPDFVVNNGPLMWPDVDVEGNRTNQGDGLILGSYVNAAIQQKHAPMTHYMGHFGTSKGGIGTAPFLRLNLNGERFMNEDQGGQAVQNQLEAQPERKCWTIFDSTWAESVPYFQAMHGCPSYVVDKPTPENLTIDGISPYIMPDAVEDAVAQKNATMFKAETIDELLALTDIRDKEKAKASIERYNELARNGKDVDFGKVATRLHTIEKGPFYTFESGMSMTLIVAGGLVSDEDCHVYDKEGKIIPGLYVAGNIQGNRYSVAYPIACKGISHSLCMFYGYIAGENAVKQI